MVCPFQVYGSWLVQMAVLVVLVKVGLTVNTNVAIESQPLAAGQISGISTGCINGLAIPGVW